MSCPSDDQVGGPRPGRAAGRSGGCDRRQQPRQPADRPRLRTDLRRRRPRAAGKIQRETQTGTPGQNHDLPPNHHHGPHYHGRVRTWIGWRFGGRRLTRSRAEHAVQAKVARQPRVLPRRTACSAAETMCSASMPAAARSASGGPLPGRSVTARRTRGVPAAASARTPATVSPMPPSAQWSSTVSSASVSPAAARIVVGVDRLDRVEVDHPRRDALAGELVGGGEAFVQGDAGADQRDLVLGAGAQRAAAADLEALAGLVEHRRRARGWCACS